MTVIDFEQTLRSNQIKMKNKYYSLNELVNLIEEPNKTATYKILRENKNLFLVAKGSKSKHQAWSGGYLDHVVETSNIALKLYPTLNSLRKLPFTSQDAVLVLFLHDLEKPWKQKYPELRMEVNNSKDKNKIKLFVQEKLKEYSYALSKDHLNALMYAEGEGTDYHPNLRIQGPLAAFVGACDNISARLWFNNPEENDSWGKRITKKDLEFLDKK